MDAKKKKKSASLLPVLVSGSISGAVSTVLLQPLDVLKTRLQSHAVGNHSSEQKRPGIVHIARNIIKEEKATTLWRGITPSLWRTVPGVSLYFCSVHLLTASAQGNPSSWRAGSAGLISRALVAVLLAPFTVVKTRYESQTFHYSSLRLALVEIFRTEGVRGLWRGTSVTVARDAPYSGLYFMFYTQAKSWKPTNLHPEDPVYILFLLSCGSAAAVAATLVTQPGDVVKTRMQLMKQPRAAHSLRHAVSSIYKDHGLAGYVQGFVPRVVKRTLMSAISWTIFEQMTRILSAPLVS